MFTALNIEPESDTEDEVDNTKEIQIEEALKLYQNALKLHSQGPQFFDQAEEAYQALFRSEVFTYLESLSEAQRVSYYENIAATSTRFEDEFVIQTVADASGADGTPSTLPQILYLSYKNHGHFLLDRLRHRLQAGWDQAFDQDQIKDAQKDILDTISSSLGLLVEALDRDDTDLELWRQLSKIGESLGSTRLARFCLEVIVDRDDISPDAWPEPLGLQEIFATERLKSLLQSINDDQSFAPSLDRKQLGLIQMFKTQLDPLPYLPTPPPASAYVKYGDSVPPIAVEQQQVLVPLRTWSSCGKAILIQRQKEEQGFSGIPAGAGYCLVLPSPNQVTHEKFDVQAPESPGLTSPKTGISVEGLHGSDNRSHSLPQYDVAFEKPRVSPLVPQERLLESATSEVMGKISGLTSPVQSAQKANGGSPCPQEIVRPKNSQENQGPTINLPTRKRSNGAAELEEGEDTGRSRSKRIKARTSVEEPSTRKDAAARQLELYQQGEIRFYELLDEQAFEQSAKLLSAFGVNAAESVNELKRQVHAVVKPSPDDKEHAGKSTPSSHDTLLRDLAFSVHNWNNEMSNIILHGGGFEDPVNGASIDRNSALRVFLEQSSLRPREGPPKYALDDDRGLELFAESTKHDWLSSDQLALAWIRALLSPKDQLSLTSNASRKSTYEALLWPDALKETVVQLLVNSDDFIFSRMFDEVRPGSEKRVHVDDLNKLHSPDAGMIQAIFEIHLDIYGRITNPSSQVDEPTRTAQRDRLQRWASVAYHAIKYEEDISDSAASKDVLYHRFLWAYAALLNICELCSRDLIILYYQKLKKGLEGSKTPIIELCNNAVMPEISIIAAEKQISRLTTMDFFTSIFSPDSDDPARLIESLEPILELSLQRDRSHPSAVSQNMPDTMIDERSKQLSSRPHINNMSLPAVDSHTEQMLQFLDKASLSMRLLLWRKLIDAYSIIQYPPQILSCYMRSVRLIICYLYSSGHLEMSEDNRRKAVLRWLKSLDELVTRTLAMAMCGTRILDCMDEMNLQDAMQSLAVLQYILHSFVVVEDLTRIGVRDPPEPVNNSAKIAYSNAMTKMREMIVKVWTLQYIFIRDSATQFTTDEPVTDTDLILYLKLTHRLLGPRQYCKLSNKVLLKVLRDEIPRIDNFADSELEAAQLILDLYGLKICPGSKEIEDHDCTPETLDRPNAIAMIDRVMIQANRLNVRDLLKSELRTTIEKMHQVIKNPKNSDGALHNRRVFNNFLRSPINPLKLYRALQGIGELPFQDLRGEIFNIAEKRWYFLQGYLALAKYRSQKRISPAGADDLDVALSFLKYDIEQGCEKWETWYRLAQVYDAKVEEESLWTADKLNGNMEEIRSLERNAIHCYTMAVATAERCIEPSFEMVQKVADLYYDFAVRIYGSSREPFEMGVFSVDKYLKHFNAGRLGTYQERPFKPLTVYGACKFASGLLRHALVQKPDNWMTWYMFGKCLWKMYRCTENSPPGHHGTGFEPALTAFKTAIETLPDRRDNKHPGKEPVLEPYYKLASVVHKLVFAGKISAENGCQILNITPYAQRVPPVQDPDDWEGYILHVLKLLRAADKSNWHHRMVLRAAHTIHDGSPNDHLALLGAKVELTQIFTKTMAIQVWKPENERVGRHFVYMTRYVQFFVMLLFELRDSVGIEAIGRQIRKKPDKFIRHGALWQETCMTHLALLRMKSGVPNDYSDSAFKNISHDLFVQNADRLETWVQQPSTTATKAPELDLMREAIELKKTNANLMKPTVIEDFIADVYASLFQRMTPELIGLENEEESRSRMRVDHLMNFEKPAASTPSPDPAGKADDIAPPRQRIRGVGRKELQKRAEALMTKPATTQTVTKAPKSPAPPSSELPPTPRSTIQVVINQRDPRNDNSSVPGSLHESADDESELSDVGDAPDSAKVRPLFPNLGDSKSGADEEERDGSDHGNQRGEDDVDAEEQEQAGRLDEEEEDAGNGDDDVDEEGEREGEETYHTPMEM
ncbi:MAG: hypothetical protein LQ337_008217 [Flavoplaca oasis]|nr:MAG: hypothetical protein LQ337_008217 [Flavoplaca oasis]